MMKFDLMKLNRYWQLLEPLELLELPFLQLSLLLSVLFLIFYVLF